MGLPGAASCQTPGEKATREMVADQFGKDATSHSPETEQGDSHIRELSERDSSRGNPPPGANLGTSQAPSSRLLGRWFLIKTAFSSPKMVPRSLTPWSKPTLSPGKRQQTESHRVPQGRRCRARDGSICLFSPWLC